MELAEIDRQVDDVVRPHARRGIEPGNEQRAIPLGLIGLELREVLGFLRVDETLEDVFHENGLCLDLHVGETISLVFDLGHRRQIHGSGSFSRCTGTGVGTLTGPESGDAGDWGVVWGN